ncbi:MAG: ABC transporter ATP-binding protein [Chitinophagaceae bacterium]|nr:ABC transporter ATP-binding protein [Chitinophagaceae bacterium]
MALLSVTGISIEGKGNFSVKDINFTQEYAQNIAIAGETGSGKTTLLKMIGGLAEPSAGEIRFEGKKILGPNDQLIPGHPGIGYLSQYFELRNNYWVRDLLEMFNKLSEEEAANLYRICQIDHLTGRKTDQLSGGEKQRIALARLLIGSTRLLLLDEPFSNLDAVHKRTIKKVIHDLGEKMNISFIMVSHDALDILSWANTILLMKDGRVVQKGTPKEVYQQPINEYCAGLLGDYNLIDVRKSCSFTSLSNVDLMGKKMLIRPEQFTITDFESNSVAGIVEQVLYWGSYYTIDVLIDQQSVRVKTNKNELTTGSRVFLSCNTEDIWLIND